MASRRRIRRQADDGRELALKIASCMNGSRSAAEQVDRVALQRQASTTTAYAAARSGGRSADNIGIAQRRVWLHGRVPAARGRASRASGRLTMVRRDPMHGLRSPIDVPPRGGTDRSAGRHLRQQRLPRRGRRSTSTDRPHDARPSLRPGSAFRATMRLPRPALPRRRPRGDPPMTDPPPRPPCPPRDRAQPADPGPPWRDLDTIVSLSKRRGFIFPSLGDLRRHQRRLGLRAARRRAQEQRQARLVARHGPGARRHRRPRRGHPHAPPGVGHLRPRRLVQRPARRVRAPAIAASASTSCPAPRPDRDATCATRPSSSASACAAPSTAGRSPRRAASTSCSGRTWARSRRTPRVVYLRPETAQGSYVNFKNVQQSSRKKLPFGIAQIGK